jgi:hypothetical protein
VEQLFAVAQFQYVGMMERIQYQESTIGKLLQKMNKQKQLLLLAKEKISEVEGLGLKVQQLQQENNNLRNFAKSYPRNQEQSSHRPTTIDLGVDDSFGSTGCGMVETSSRDTISDTFIKQIKKNSSQKSSVNKPYAPHYTSTNQIKNFSKVQSPQGPNSSMEFAKSKIAESTNILSHHGSPLRSNVPLGNNLHPVVNRMGSSNSNCTLSSGSKGLPYSNGSPNTSIPSSNNFITPHGQSSKGQPRILPLHQPPSGSSNIANNNANRGSKQRASTSQLAQRLSTHMKIGSLQRAKSSSVQDGNENCTRPRSSFSSNKFRR